jgi:hypothetical protein
MTAATKILAVLMLFATACATGDDATADPTSTAEQEIQPVLCSGQCNFGGTEPGTELCFPCDPGTGGGGPMGGGDPGAAACRFLINGSLMCCTILINESARFLEHCCITGGPSPGCFYNNHR